MPVTKTFFGFFFQEGSPDYPSNMNPTSRFGFSTISPGTPIFDYSITDVQRSIVTPRVLSRVGHYFNARTSKLFLERFEHDYVETVDPITNSDWGKIFRILEYAYNNQLGVTAAAAEQYNGASGYLNAGDELFYTGVSGSMNIVDAVRAGEFGYQIRTFKFDPSDKAERISALEFQYKTSNDGLYAFRIYLDPDFFIERAENAKYAVYRYEEIVNDGQIDQSEFSTQIVDKLFQILQGGLYNRYDTFDTIKRVDEVVGGIPTGNKVDQPERLYVFTTYRNSPGTITLRSFVKNYLRNLYPASQLKQIYPSLFTEDSVDILPVYDNLVSTFGNAQQLMAHPVPLEAIRTRLLEFQLEFIPTNSAYKPVEVFYVGGDEDTSPLTSTRNVYPILAVEQSEDSGITTRPISSRFPDYKPLSGIVFSSGNPVAQQFHHFLVLALDIVNAVISINDLPNLIRTTYNYQVSVQNANQGGTLVYDIVTFEFENVSWSVYGKKRPV